MVYPERHYDSGEKRLSDPLETLFILLPQLIVKYGYWAILVGTFIEGETVLLLGVMAVMQGYLKLPGVIFMSFLGVLGSDQLYFHLGRWKGKTWLEKRPRLHRKADKALGWLRRYERLFILGFRFVYSVRVVTPVLIALSGVSAWVYLCYNLISCAVWAIVFGVLGYYLFWGAHQVFAS